MRLFEIIDLESERNRRRLARPAANDQSNSDNQFEPENQMLRRMTKHRVPVDTPGSSTQPMIPAKQRYTDQELLAVIARIDPPYAKFIEDEVSAYETKHGGKRGANSQHPLAVNGVDPFALFGADEIQKDHYAKGVARFNMSIPGNPSYTGVDHTIATSRAIRVMKNIFGAYATEVTAGGGLGSQVFVVLSPEFLKDVK